MTKKDPKGGAVCKGDLRRSGRAKRSPEPNPEGNRAERRAAASQARRRGETKPEEKKPEEKKPEEKKPEEKKPE